MRNRPKYTQSSQSGFTLVELLVVIALMLVVSSIIFVVGKGGSGAALSSSERIISGLAKGARGQAILKNAETRLIIYSNSGGNSKEDQFLRQVGIVYWGEETDAAGNVIATGWLAGSQGVTLPDGIYFDPDTSSLRGGGTIPTMTLDYPRRKVGANTNQASGGGSEEYYYYAFNSNGTIAASPDDFNNSRLIFRAGILVPDSTGNLDIEIEDADEYIAAGLIFRRVGTTTSIKDPTEALK